MNDVDFERLINYNETDPHYETDESEFDEWRMLDCKGRALDINWSNKYD